MDTVNKEWNIKVDFITFYKFSVTVTMELNVNVKSVSGKKNRITTIPINYSRYEMTVRELIEETVQFCVSDYNRRKENGELLRALLTQEIEEKAAQGKISFGVIYGEKDADLKKAMNDAVEAFSDGVVAIFADERRLESLDEELKLNEINSLTFIRLIMLAGRMW